MKVLTYFDLSYSALTVVVMRNRMMHNLLEWAFELEMTFSLYFSLPGKLHVAIEM